MTPTTPVPRPFSEPESRLIARLVRRLHPAATIWYHQALDLVDLGTAGDPALVRRYARLSGLPARRLDFLPGVATRWQNHLDGREQRLRRRAPVGRAQPGGRGATRARRPADRELPGGGALQVGVETLVHTLLVLSKRDRLLGKGKTKHLEHRGSTLRVSCHMNDLDRVTRRSEC